MSNGIKNGRWWDAAANTVLKLVVGAAVGGAVATGLATISDNANAARIEAMAETSVEFRSAVLSRLSSIESEMAVYADRQERVRMDIAEIKEILRER